MEGNEFRNPYAAPTASVEPATATHHATHREPEKAGRLSRLLAAFGDLGAVLLTLLPVLLAAALHDAGSPVSATASIAMLLTAIAFVALAVTNLVLLHREGQTIGKRWIGIRIVRNDGSRAGLGRLFLLRGIVPGVVGAVPYLGVLFSLGNVLWIFGEEKRCLHDYIADTVVVTA